MQSSPYNYNQTENARTFCTSGPLLDLPYWKWWYFINCPFHIIGNLIKTSVLRPLVEHFTIKMLHQERFIRNDPTYLKEWEDSDPGANMGPCTLSFDVIY